MVPPPRRALAAIEEARQAIAAGRQLDAMLAIGRADAEYGGALQEAQAQFRAVLGQLASMITGEILPQAGRRGFLH
ncbi:MAG: hypothetical protein HYV09_13005 [Deltaproteobacteria bacterium]|nr:hypothetical protein [Deltaproteobacteria bacterium]